MRREGLFKSFVSFVDDSEGNPVYENTMQYAILKHEWISNQKAGNNSLERDHGRHASGLRP